MSLPDSTPNYFDNTEVGAPVINNTAGAVVAALMAVGVVGFNVRPVLQVSVTSGVATAMCLGHGYSAAFGKLVKLSGVSVPALNGNKRLLSVSTDAITYDATGVADGVYSTGSMEARRAPLGWEVAHVNGANTEAIFRRPSPEASVSMLRVIDTKATPAGTLYCLASMVESATDINTVVNEVPVAAANKAWARGADTATAKKWIVVGNARRAWVMLQGSTSHTQVIPYLYGDPAALYPGDNLGAILAGHGDTNMGAAGGLCRANPITFVPEAGLAFLNFQRNLLGDSVAAKASLCGAGLWGENLYTAGGATQVPIAGDYYLKTATEVRARLPELFLPQANRPFDNGTIYEHGGRRLLCITISTGATNLGQMMLDLASDWG